VEKYMCFLISLRSFEKFATGSASLYHQTCECTCVSMCEEYRSTEELGTTRTLETCQWVCVQVCCDGGRAGCIAHRHTNTFAGLAIYPSTAKGKFFQQLWSICT